ncbi:hypothetical protein BT96DRAFT_1000870 [Gymnopus androsaceus JB14]|uniref:Uncharacterized protein n=1 Tax=Gymnopus androsaceus JB14 TaxID=1447944 RepID=A0A6A4H1G8_9AGAR|nr:hypothetical protein BT96DRAFT_1000870 [Gymnopus androsaceus JB14]
MGKRGSNQIQPSHSLFMTSIGSSPAVTSTAQSSPATMSTSSGFKCPRCSKNPSGNNGDDNDNSDVELVTPMHTKHHKSTGLAMQEKAVAFKATFADGLSDKVILEKQMKGWTSKY